MKGAGGNEAPFTIVLARIFKRGVEPCENQRRIGEIQSPLGQRFRTLGWVEGDANRICVATINPQGNTVF